MANRVVYVLRALDSKRDELDRPSGQRLLEPVGDKARYVQVHADGQLPDINRDLKNSVGAIIRDPRMEDYLAEWKNMGWKSEMGSDDYFRLLADLGHHLNWNA